MKRVGIATLLVAIAILLMPGTDAYAATGTALSGVVVGNVDVTGKTEQEIQAIVADQIAVASAAELNVKCVDDSTEILKLADIGLKASSDGIASEAVGIGKRGNIIARYKARKDLQRENTYIAIPYEVDRELVAEFVTALAQKYNREAENVSLIKTDDGFEVTEGKSGVIIDETQATDYLIQYITSEWNGENADVDLPVIEDKPLGSAEELAQIKDIIGSYKTSYKTSASDRSTNVANGCRLVNGTTLYPGEEFSMYDHIKPFTEENGYRMAGSYVNGLVVDSLGGGICQVSTTLYNAVLKAELQVNERNNHSMIVTYVSPSADAAISESSGKDFKFVNSTDTPIYIEGYTTPEKEIVFNIYGKETRPSNRTVEYESEVLEKQEPMEENIIPSAEYPVGYCSVQSAHVGYKAQLVKVVKVDGAEESREVINSSTYKMVPRTAVVGIATADPDASAKIQEAIATGSIDYVKAVAGGYAAAAAQAAAQAAANANVNP